VLLIACSAVVTGATSFVAISEWAAEAPQDALARLGARTATALAVRIPPSGATIRRSLWQGHHPPQLVNWVRSDAAHRRELAAAFCSL
jgi:hypothetical protein